MTSFKLKIGMVIGILSPFLQLSAKDFSVDGLDYVLLDSTTKEVAVSGAAHTRSINIPNTVIYDNVEYSVVKINAWALANKDTINSLSIGAGIVSIGDNAFKNTSVIKAFWLGNTPPKGSSVGACVNYVSNEGYGFTKQKIYPFLSSRFSVDGIVYVPVSPAERTCDVIDCDGTEELIDVNVSDKVVNKGIELSVCEIGDYSFFNRDDIRQVTLSNQGNVGDYAFYDCDGLQSCEVSNHGNVGDYAFYDCDNLQTARLANWGYIGEKIFYGCSSLQSAVISNHGGIGYKAFVNCSDLSEVEIYSKGYIGLEAFKDCENLCSAVISNEGSIWPEAFCGCSRLCNVTLGPKVTYINNDVFRDCDELIEISIPNSVVEIGENAFYGCKSLRKVTLGHGLSKIKRYTFDFCSSLESINIPNSIMNIEKYSFRGCKSLKNVTFEDSKIHELGEYKGYGSWTADRKQEKSEKEYNLNVKAGDVLTFNYWIEAGYGDELTVKINENWVIEEETGSKNFGKYFKEFKDDGYVTIKVTFKQYFLNFPYSKGGIMDLCINSEDAYTGIGIGSNDSEPLFSDCPLDNVYIGRKLIYDGSKECGYSPFYRNTTLRTVEISDQETKILDNEFYGCSNLRLLKMGDGVKSIGNWAFSGCAALEYFSAGEHVESIGEEAFSDCTRLTKYYSSSLNPPVCGNQALDDINKWECTLYVPSESKNEYKTAPQWKEFFFIEDFAWTIILNNTELNLSEGDVFQLMATIFPGNTTNENLSWESSDESVVMVSESGLLTAIGAGNAIVSVKNPNGGEASCNVTVTGDSGIDNVHFLGNEMKIKIQGMSVSILNIDDASVEIYAIDGKLMFKTAGYEGEEINLNPGFYLVKSGKQILKFKI